MKYKLGNIVKEIIDYRGKTPKKLGFDWSESGIRAFSAKNIKTGQIVQPESIRYVSEENYPKWMKQEVERGTILITSEAPFGQIFYWNSDEKIVLSQRLFAIKIKDEFNSKFVYYQMTSDKFQSELKARATGSTVTGLRQPELMKCEIDLPDLKTQKKIVRILSALDQKIELNNQQNKTLFELGQKLYVEKFENDETIAKIELKNFFPVVTGKKDANASSENGRYPFFTCSKTISKIDDYVFDNSAILLAGNGDFNVKFYRGKFDAYQRTYVLIPNNPEYLGFLYWAISYSLPRITANYRGSVIKFITKGNIENFEVPFVDNEYIPVFMRYLEKIEKNNQEDETLSRLRDTLLPKLMSGDINLGEATINE